MSRQSERWNALSTANRALARAGGALARGGRHGRLARSAHRGAPRALLRRGASRPPAQARQPAAADLLLTRIPEDVLLHEARLAATGLPWTAPLSASALAASLGILASATPDAHHGAALQLAGGAAARAERKRGGQGHAGRFAAPLPAGARRLARVSHRGARRAAARGKTGQTATRSSRRRPRSEPGDRSAVARGTSRRGRRRPSLRAASRCGGHRISSRARSRRIPTPAGPRTGSSRCSRCGPSLVKPPTRCGPRWNAPTSRIRRSELGTGLARIAFDHLHDPTVALEALRRVRKKAPGHVRSLLLFAEACSRLKLWAETAEAATSALGITRDAEERLVASVLLAEAQAQVRRHTRGRPPAGLLGREARGDGTRRLRSSLFLRIAKVHRGMGDAAAAERALLRALVFGPADAAPRQWLEEALPLVRPPRCSVAFSACWSRRSPSPTRWAFR